MKRGAKQKLEVGDYFIVPLEDESYGCGQVLAMEPLTLKNAAICAFFSCRLRDASAESLVGGKVGRAISVLWVTRDLLDNGTWKVVGRGEALNPRIYFPDLDSRRAKGFVGTRIHGSGIARTFLNAYFGLCPWNDFADPNYLDKLLAEPALRPEGVILVKDGSRM